MRNKRLMGSGVLAALVLVLMVGLATAQAPQGAPLGTGFIYQGQLKSNNTPYTGTCDVKFGLYDALTGGTQVGTLTKTNIATEKGLFTVQLDYGAGKFTGDALWLELSVRCPAGSGAYTLLSPRQALMAAPYALYAERAGNGWSLSGNSGTTPDANYLGTSDNVPFEIKVNGQRSLRLEPNAGSPNLIGGYGGNVVTDGVAGATIGGGGAGGGFENRVTDSYGAVGGGQKNRAGDGAGTTSDRLGATVAGGTWNTASGHTATVGGGDNNTASGYGSTIGGGDNNTASGDWATIAGGGSSDRSNPTTTSNRVTDAYGTVGGGGNNRAGNNSGSGTDAMFATIGGGYDNEARGANATVPGGASNTASGQYSFAAGWKAKALHNGSFVWADSTGAEFSSTAPNQFAIRANYGVKIVREANTFSGSHAALQVETGGGGEAAWFYTTNPNNDSNVLKLLKQPVSAGSDANFIKGVEWTGSGGEATKFWIDASGTWHGPSDFAEALPVVGDPVSYEPGDVLVISLDRPGGVEKCSQPYDGRVVGVYSTRPGFLGADKGGVTEVRPDDVPVAVLGIVPVKVSAENGPIQPGALLTTSSTPGHAMRCQGLELCFGRTLGKALETLPAGQNTGVIRMLVTLQ